MGETTMYGMLFWAAAFAGGAAAPETAADPAMPGSVRTLAARTVGALSGADCRRPRAAWDVAATLGRCAARAARRKLDRLWQQALNAAPLWLLTLAGGLAGRAFQPLCGSESQAWSESRP